MFTTPSGQTGRDAYVFTAQAIANQIRFLKEQFATVLDAAHNEHPELFANSADWMPQFDACPCKAQDFVEYLKPRSREQHGTSYHTRDE